jgi:hypothetical protein
MMQLQPINLIKQLRRAAEDTAPSTPPVRPEQMLFWKAADEIELLYREIGRLQDIINISETPKDWVDVLVDDVMYLTDIPYEVAAEMSIKELLDTGAMACFIQNRNDDISDRIRTRLNKVINDAIEDHS